MARDPGSPASMCGRVTRAPSRPRWSRMPPGSRPGRRRCRRSRRRAGGTDSRHFARAKEALGAFLPGQLATDRQSLRKTARASGLTPIRGSAGRAPIGHAGARREGGRARLRAGLRACRRTRRPSGAACRGGPEALLLEDSSSLTAGLEGVDRLLGEVEAGLDPLVGRLERRRRGLVGVGGGQLGVLARMSRLAAARSALAWRTSPLARPSSPFLRARSPLARDWTARTPARPIRAARVAAEAAVTAVRCRRAQRRARRAKGSR